MKILENILNFIKSLFGQNKRHLTTVIVNAKDITVINVYKQNK